MKRIWFLVILLILAAFGVYLLRPKFWDSGEKLVMVINGKNQKIVVSVIDPQSSTWTDIEIPGSVSVQVAGELGSWRLGSVWQLGVNEKLGGGLLARTMVKNFAFPVVAWQDEATGRTNLGLGDRIRLRLLRLKMSRGPADIIDLTKTSFLRKAKLADGEWGWRLAGGVPSNVAALFPGKAALQAGYKARIINYSGTSGVGENLGRVVETMGVKVASVQKEAARDFDCAISGADDYLVKRLNFIFDCKDKAIEGAEDFDVNLEVGGDFIRRF